MQNLRYTKDTGVLTLEQRTFYEKNGYLLFPKLVSQEIIDKCHKRFDDIISNKISPGGIIVMKDIKDRKTVNKIQDINHDEIFREYIEYDRLLDIVECFTGPNIMAVHSMLIAKPPDIGYGSSRHPPHQDLYYFPFRPADVIVAAWTAMETCNQDNGCLFVAPGSHTEHRLHAHNYPKEIVNKLYYGILDLPENIAWQNLEMEAGDTVFFHPLLIHGSWMNKSNRTRRAISCHYASSECHYIDVKETIQKPVEDEVMEIMRKKYPGIDVTYADIWRYKSTLVRGIRSNL